MPRQQLPPQIKKIEVEDRASGKTVVRYRVKVDIGPHPVTGKRQQSKRHCRTEAEARKLLSELQNKAATGTYVSPSKVTDEQVCADYLAGRHNLRESSLAKLTYDLAPLRERHGKLPAQKLTKAHVDLTAKTLEITNNRVSAGGTTVENDPKSQASRRELPLPERLVKVLRTAKTRQSTERLALGEHYGAGDYVVCNEIGEPYNPAVLSRYWADAVAAAGVRHIKLHGGRHTAATLMHLDGVPVAVIAAWIGHSDPTLTLRVYAHSQDDALKAAGTSLDGPNKSSI